MFKRIPKFRPLITITGGSGIDVRTRGDSIVITGTGTKNNVQKNT